MGSTLGLITDEHVNREVTTALALLSYPENGSSAFLRRSRDSSVGIPTGYGLDDRSYIPDRGKTFCPYTVRTGCEAHPDSYPIGNGGDGKAAEV
jgi:hypothetical protein